MTEADEGRPGFWTQPTPPGDVPDLVPAEPLGVASSSGAPADSTAWIDAGIDPEMPGPDGTLATGNELPFDAEPPHAAELVGPGHDEPVAPGAADAGDEPLPPDVAPPERSAVPDGSPPREDLDTAGATSDPLPPDVTPSTEPTPATELTSAAPAALAWPDLAADDIPAAMSTQLEEADLPGSDDGVADTRVPDLIAVAAEEAARDDAPAASGEVTASTLEVFSERPGLSRVALGRRGLVLAAALLALFMLGGAGISYAAYDLGRDYEGRILPGATIAGVDVGGMSRDRAVEAVGRALRPRLTRPIVVQWGARKWKVTPEELGARSNASRAVDRALKASAKTSLLERARMRVLGDDFAFDRRVGIRYPRGQVRGFVEGLASSFDREPADAFVDTSTGWVDVRKEEQGRVVRVGRSTKSLLEGLREDASHVPLAVTVTEPEVTADDFDQVLLLRIGENKLYLYDDGEIIRTYTVATGQPSYPTPTGTYEITEKRYLPTWVNPAPDGWGASMPASIPPGPGNPLGLRALNWSAPAIRFHGTSATYSLGYNASHGCVRMSNTDVIELYDLVDVGTPIVSIIAGPLRPMYSSSSVPVAENSAD